MEIQYADVFVVYAYLLLVRTMSGSTTSSQRKNNVAICRRKRSFRLAVIDGGRPSSVCDVYYTLAVRLSGGCVHSGMRTANG